MIYTNEEGVTEVNGLIDSSDLDKSVKDELKASNDLAKNSTALWKEVME